MPDSSSKSGSLSLHYHGPLFRRDRPGIRFSSRNAGFQLEKRIPKTTFITAPFSGGTGRGSAFRAGMPDSSLKSGSPTFRAGMPDSSSKSASLTRQPSSRPPFRRDWPGIRRQPSSRPPFRKDWAGIRFSSWNAGFQLEKRIPKTTFTTASFRRDWPGIRFSSWNLHHGPLSGGIGRGSAFRAGMPDSSSKSRSPRQPSSRPPFRRDWPGIRFSSWNAKFQLEKRIPKTTFITAPFQEGLAGDPLFELECRIPARKADPQDNLHHGPPFRRDWPGIRFSSWNAGFQLEKRIPKTTFITRPPFRRDGPGIRFSSRNAGFQLEKRIPKTTFITAPFSEGLAGDPLFELECRIPARKADPQDNLHHGPLFRRDLPGIRFSSWNAGFQLEKRIPKTTFITAPFSGGIGRGSAFRAGMPDSSSKSGSPKTTFITAPFSGGTGRGSAFLAGMPDSSSKSGSPRQPSSRPPFQEGLAGDPLFELECRIPARKADPQDNLHHGPLFRRDWPGIRFSSWNAGFQLEKRIPKTTFITAPFQEGSAFSAETVLCFSAHLVVFFRSARAAPSLL